MAHVLRHGAPQRRLSPLWHHLGQMLVVMMVGMVGAAAIYLGSIGMSADQAFKAHPMAILLVVSAGMSIPMAAWMLFRGMGWRNSAEMAAAMALPVIPFLCLVWGGVSKSAQCGPYCLASLVAMIGLLFYRRDRYSVEMSTRRALRGR